MEERFPIGTIIAGVGVVVGHDHLRDGLEISSGLGGKFMPYEEALALEVDLEKPEEIEAYLNDDQQALSYKPRHKQAEAIPCPCGCSWCYQVSSNGFHMKNAGQCRCSQKNCPCV